MPKKKGRGGGAKCGRAGGTKQQQPLHLQQQNNTTNQQQLPTNNVVRHKTHQNQFLQQQRRLQMQRNEMQRQRTIMKAVRERQEWKKDIFKHVLNAEETRNENMEKETMTNADASLCNGVEKSMVVSDFAHPDETRGDDEEEEVIREENKFQDNVLPPLFARVDADTLLARLNTRRLYKRLRHYKREDQRKLAEHLAKYANADENGNNGNVVVEVESIIEMFEGDLKNEQTANRIYPKDMTISEMAEKEWDDLMVSYLIFIYLWSFILVSSFSCVCTHFTVLAHLISGCSKPSQPGHEIALRSISDTV